MIVGSVQKHPAAVLDYALDLKPWIAPGDSIQTVSWDVPQPLTQPQASTVRDGRYAVVWLAGGEDSTEYVATATIATAAGRVDLKAIQIKVNSRAIYAQASHARTMVEAIEAVLQNRATLEQESYRIADRELKRISPMELIKLHRHFEQRVQAEEIAAGLRPKGAGGLIYARVR